MRNMNRKHRFRYNVIIVPIKAVVPGDVDIPVKAEGDLIERISACREEEMIIPVTVRELQFIVEYRDLLDMRVRAVIGLTGAMYNSMWNMYISPLERVTIPMLIAERAAYLDEESVQGQVQPTNALIRANEINKARVKQTLSARGDKDAAHNPSHAAEYKADDEGDDGSTEIGDVE